MGSPTSYVNLRKMSCKVGNGHITQLQKITHAPTDQSWKRARSNHILWWQTWKGKRKEHKFSNHCPSRCWQSNKMADQDFYSSQKRDSTSFPQIHPASGVRKILWREENVFERQLWKLERGRGRRGDTIFKTSGVNSRRIEFFRLIQFKRGWLGRPRSSQWDGIAGNFSKIRNRDFHQISFSSQNWGPERGYFDVGDFYLANNIEFRAILKVNCETKHCKRHSGPNYRVI